MRTFTFMLLGLLIAETAHADPPTGFGVGIVVGEPTGLSFGARSNPWNAVHAYATWSITRDRARFGLTYNQSLAIVRPEGAPDLEFPLYVGIGGDIAVWDQGPAFGARIPFGVAMLPRDVPIDVFAEVGPTVWLLPDVTPAIDGVVGVRGWF